MPVTFAFGMWTIAMAFASWSATYAVFPSIATYSGSRLRLTGRSSPWGAGPNTRTSAGSAFEAPASYAWKSAVLTSFCFAAAILLGSFTTLTEPSGSTEKSSAGSPSFATTAYLPSGARLTMSGSAPTVTSPRTAEAASVAFASKKTRWPGSVLTGASKAMTPRPSARTATEFATPSELSANSCVIAVGSE